MSRLATAILPTSLVGGNPIARQKAKLTCSVCLSIYLFISALSVFTFLFFLFVFFFLFYFTHSLAQTFSIRTTLSPSLDLPASLSLFLLNIFLAYLPVSCGFILQSSWDFISTSVRRFSDSSTLSSFDFSSELSSDTSSSVSSKSSSPKDFAIIQTNSYGERDIRVVLGSVRLHVLSVPSDTRYQLELRRTSDRRHYVKSVYKKGLLLLTPPHRTAASNLTVVAGHVKERQISNPGGRRRSRRQLNGMLIYPGTKWCGNGNTAEAFDDLGSEAAADICCREHDYCPFTIESFTRRFNLFNYRLHTLSHCECDYQ
ncbi:PLA2G [Acanthosepion pharaonis]|uniref:PLA2G n=1 Tax=Acanthosepion pharaonis TaxID=158019 RepID=A0A812CRT9_ACAPH|nr:PLA2G [Sepia pharaonis]